MKIIVFYPDKTHRIRLINEYKEYMAGVAFFDACSEYTIFGFNFKCLSAIASFLRAASSESIVHVHSSTAAPLIIILSRCFNFRVIYVCHGSLAMSTKLHERLVGKFLEFFNILFASKTLVISSFIIKYLPITNYKKIVSFPSPGIFTYKGFDSSKLFEKTGLKKYNVAFVGRRVARKGFNRFLSLIDEYLECERKEFELEFHVFGLGMKIPSHLVGIINDHGFVHNKEEILETVDLVLCMSNFEGFSEVSAEALSAGCMVFHSNVPGMDWLPFVFDGSISGLFDRINRVKQFPSGYVARSHEVIDSIGYDNFPKASLLFL